MLLQVAFRKCDVIVNGNKEMRFRGRENQDMDAGKRMVILAALFCLHDLFPDADRELPK